MIHTSSSDQTLSILQVLPSLVSGGVERGTLDLCQHLIDHGHKAWVISSGGPLVNTLENMGATHIQLDVHSKNPFVMWKNSRKLYQLFKQHAFDLVHVRSRAPAWSCYWASNQANIPLVTTFHGQYSHQYYLKRLYNHIMLKGETCIAVSQFIESHIKQVYSTSTTRIKLIHRGIDLTTFKPSLKHKTNASLLKKKWNIPAHSIVIVLPGRLTRLKGHQTFLEAIEILKQHTNIYGLIVGDEPGKTHYQEELQDWITQHHLSERVQLTGNCYDMPAVYQLADIVISASIKPESFGRTACEAQAMGCMVIATQHGGSLETIAPVQQQFMCEVKNSESMAKAIQKALHYCDPSQQQERLKIEDRSRAFIDANFSLEKMCTETLALYQEIITNNSRQT